LTGLAILSGLAVLFLVLSVVCRFVYYLVTRQLLKSLQVEIGKERYVSGTELKLYYFLNKPEIFKKIKFLDLFINYGRLAFLAAGVLLAVSSFMCAFGLIIL